MPLYRLAFYISLLAILVPITLTLGVYRRQSVAFKWFTLILLLSIGCDLAGYSMRLMKVYSSNIPGNVHTLFNPVFFSFFFYYLIKGRTLRNTLIVVNILMFGFTLFDLSFEKPSFISISTLTESFLILTLCVVYYFKLLKELPADDIRSLPEFWVTSGFFISTAGKFIVYGVSNYLLIQHNDNLGLLLTIHNFLSILGWLIVARGAWLQFKLITSRSAV